MKLKFLYAAIFWVPLYNVLILELYIKLQVSAGYGFTHVSFSYKSDPSYAKTSVG